MTAPTTVPEVIARTTEILTERGWSDRSPRTTARAKITVPTDVGTARHLLWWEDPNPTDPVFDTCELCLVAAIAVAVGLHPCNWDLLTQPPSSDLEAAVVKRGLDFEETLAAVNVGYEVVRIAAQQVNREPWALYAWNDHDCRSLEQALGLLGSTLFAARSTDDT